MKHMKKMLALVLVVMSVLAIAVPAMAASSTISPGASKYKSYSISSSPSYFVYLAGSVPIGMVCTVTLSLNDLNDPNPDGTPNWKKSAVVVLTKGIVNSATISPTSMFNFISGRSDMARLQFKAASSNTSNIIVYYPN